MNSKVFISGSIAITKLSNDVKESIDKIIANQFEILVGDADGIDKLVQNYCLDMNYFNITVYSITSIPRYKASNHFQMKKVFVGEDIKKERERQQEKDKAMTEESDYSLIIWDGKSKGSYANIVRALENGKKVKVYLDERFLEPEKTTKEEIDFVYRANNGYTASEVVEFLKESFCDFFTKTQDLNKYLLQKAILTKDNGVYIPNKEYEELFFVDKYRGKITGIRFKNEFIDWIESMLKKPNGVQASLF
jgi:hypothetical protein